MRNTGFLSVAMAAVAAGFHGNNVSHIFTAPPNLTNINLVTTTKAQRSSIHQSSGTRAKRKWKQRRAAGRA